AQPAADQPANIRSNIRLFVRTTPNLLLVQVPDDQDAGTEAFLSSLEYALARGIEAAFQIEDNELAVERIGEGEDRRILFWEAAEGGLGVLRRLADEPAALARVARHALEILHFNPDTGEDLA